MGRFTWANMIWKGNVERGPLVERAWVFQVLLLAPRVLHCGTHQFFWHYKELRASGDLPYGTPEFIRPSANVGEEVAPQLQVGNEQDPYEKWYHLVSGYSGLALTFPEKDQVAAISGLAKKIDLPQEEYLAGLWRQKLERGMIRVTLWHYIKLPDLNAYAILRLEEGTLLTDSTKTPMIIARGLIAKGALRFILM